MRRAPAVLAAFAVLPVLAGIVAPAPARAATHQVRVEDNVFLPPSLQIEPGDTVTWTAVRTGHTVTADNGRFDFPGDRRHLEVGERASWTFAAEEDVRYYCRIHGGPGGQGMAGVVRVGRPPAKQAPAAPRLVVPDDVRTIREAAAGARPGTEVLVRPGTYREEVVVTVPRLTIRGLGRSRDAVVLQGDDALDVGVTVAAPGVRVENLTVAGFDGAGIAVGGSSGTVVRDVALRANGLHGIDASGVAGLTVRDVHVSGHGVAGIGVRQCTQCGVLVEGGLVEANAAGIVAVEVTGVVVRGVTVRANAVGVVLRDAHGSTVTGARVVDNDATDVWVASAAAGSELPTGAGVWVVGGRRNVVSANVVTGHTYNLAVTGPLPSREHRIVDNVVDGAQHADVGVDGIGVGLCVTGNRAPGGTVATSDPPVLASSDCSQPATAAAPHPPVTANLLLHARTTGFPN